MTVGLLVVVGVIVAAALIIAVVIAVGRSRELSAARAALTAAPAEGIAEAAEGEAADLPQRRIRAGNGQLALAIADPDEALGCDVVAAGIGELLVVELRHGTAGLVVDVPAAAECGRHWQVD